MTDPDYKALCAELVVIEDAMSGGSVQLSSQGQALDGYAGLAAFRYIAAKARIALAQPKPVAPTDEELIELMPQQMRDDLAAAVRLIAGYDNPKAAGAMRVILNRHAVDHARAVLARWGTPANNTREEN
jgi:hypothetical protein